MHSHQVILFIFHFLLLTPIQILSLKTPQLLDYDFLEFDRASLVDG